MWPASAASPATWLVREVVEAVCASHQRHLQLSRRPSFAPATDAALTSASLAPSSPHRYPELPVLATRKSTRPRLTEPLQSGGGTSTERLPSGSKDGLLLIRDISSQARYVQPDEFPDDRCLEPERAARLTPTLTLTVAYVATRNAYAGRRRQPQHNPNEAAINLPASYNGYNGQRCTMIQRGAPAARLTYWYRGQRRHLHAELCSATTSALYQLHGQQYVTPVGESNISSGMCGWDKPSSTRATTRTPNTTPASHASPDFLQGAAVTVNYNWAAAFDENTTYWTGTTP